MRVVGHPDRLSVAAGGTIRCVVSCRDSQYAAQVVRLQHGDINLAGPGFNAEAVPSSIDGFYVGREQHNHAGSYIVVPNGRRLKSLRSFTLLAWISLTLFGRGEKRALLGRWSSVHQCRYALYLTGDNDLAVRIGGGPAPAAPKLAKNQPKEWLPIE